MTATHATFTIEREYKAAPQRVFAAWSDPASKAAWFAGPNARHELDFRVGGREIAGAGKLTFETTYRDIVPGERIVYTSTLHDGDTLSTVSLTTVQFVADGEGARLLLTEQGAYLDDHEQPQWREQGANDQLTALGRLLEES